LNNTNKDQVADGYPSYANCGYTSSTSNAQGKKSGIGMGEFITCGTMFHGRNQQ